MTVEWTMKWWVGFDRRGEVLWKFSLTWHQNKVIFQTTCTVEAQDFWQQKNWIDGWMVFIHVWIDYGCSRDPNGNTKGWILHISPLSFSPFSSWFILSVFMMMFYHQCPPKNCWAPHTTARFRPSSNNTEMGFIYLVIEDSLNVSINGVKFKCSPTFLRF